jgi:hypothetical protein
VIIQPVLPPELQGLPVEVLESRRVEQQQTQGADGTTTIQTQESEVVK